jgi:hypothetical protein
MIPQLSGQAVKISRLHANETEYTKFMELRNEAMAYYNSLTEGLTRKFFSPRLIAQVPMANVNITRRVTDRTSEVYMVEAMRTAGTDAQTANYKKYTPRKHQRMQRLERFTNLLEVELFHPYWNEATMTLDHTIISEFKPFFDMWGNLEGVRYPLVQSSNTDATDDQLYVEWALDGFSVVDENDRVKKEEAWDGPFPFVLSWREEPEYFYDHLPSPDLIAGNRVINFYETILAAGLGFQAFGQPYVTGIQDPNQAKSIEWDVSQILALPEGASAGILNSSINANDVIEAERNLYKMVARNYHLPEDFVEGSAQAESGVAIKLRNQELQNERIGDVARWRNFEHELFNIERFILDSKGVSVGPELGVDFSETQEYLSDDEQRSRDDWDLQKNLITVPQIAMRRNPDLNDAEAEQMITANAEQNATVTKAATPGNGLADLLSAPVG